MVRRLVNARTRRALIPETTEIQARSFPQAMWWWRSTVSGRAPSQAIWRACAIRAHGWDARVARGPDGARPRPGSAAANPLGHMVVSEREMAWFPGWPSLDTRGASDESLVAARPSLL